MEGVLVQPCVGTTYGLLHPLQGISNHLLPSIELRLGYACHAIIVPQSRILLLRKQGSEAPILFLFCQEFIHRILWKRCIG
jgi:hypothetical protein